MKLLEVNLDRVMTDIEAITRFNQTPELGYTRFSYSEEDCKTRDYLKKQFDVLSLKTTIDPVGNIHARLEGENKKSPSVAVGSHIDTVKFGGKYDGLLGTVAALEVVRRLIEEEVHIKRPVDILVFSEEEGSNFKSTLVGSKVLTGKLKIDELYALKNEKGISILQILEDCGLPSIAEYSFIQPEIIDAFIELHVEQGNVLDLDKVPIGIVEAIAGIETYQIDVFGVSNHAGATPMKNRKDPMVAVGILIQRIEKLAKNTGTGTTVGTVGRILCEPNVPNVIPGKVSLTLDARDVVEFGICNLVENVKRELHEICSQRGLKYEMNLVGSSKPVKLSNQILERIQQTCSELDYSYKIMNSGAVHDAAIMNNITEVGMIFVPSIDGRSHTSEEDTSIVDIKKGCDVLLNTVISLAMEGPVKNI